MTSTPLPDNWRSFLAGYVLNDLTTEETAQVQDWLAEYPEVAAELAALEASWHTLPEGLPPQSPPSQLRDRVLNAVQASSANDSPAPTPVSPTPARPPRRPARPWGFAWLGVGWVATAAALVAVVVENQRLRQELLQSEAVVASFSQPDNRLYTLAGTEAQPQASGRLVVDPDDKTALMITENLPPLMTDQVYRLWAIAGQEPLFCGQFNPDAEQSTDRWQLPDVACGDAGVQMLITEESADAPPIPAGTLVLQSQS
jgi:hypothetical protein